MVAIRLVLESNLLVIDLLEAYSKAVKNNLLLIYSLGCIGVNSRGTLYPEMCKISEGKG